MKNFALGFLICALLYGSASRALEISLHEVSIKDVFAGVALAGLISNPNVRQDSPEALVQTSWRYSFLMMKHRKQ